MEKVIYTNGFALALSPVEAIISFMVNSPERQDIDEAVLPTLQERVADVRMNPIVAKQLLFALQQSVSEFEKVYGEIRVPEVSEELHDE